MTIVTYTPNGYVIDEKGFLKCRREGQSLKQIALDNHIAYKTLKRCIKRQNIQDDFRPVKKHAHKTQKIQKALVANAREHAQEIVKAYYHDHMSIKKLAKTYDVSETTIFEIVKHNKPIDLQLKGVDRGMVIALLKAGWKVETVGYEVGISPEAVTVIVRDHVKQKRNELKK